jgi:hypothetical protein
MRKAPPETDIYFVFLPDLLARMPGYSGESGIAGQLKS